MRSVRFFLFLFILPMSVYALYNGNPSLPMMPEEGAFISKEKWLGLKAGYLLDDVYDRKLKREGHPEGGRGKVREFTSFANLGVVTLNFNERVEAFTTLGSLSCKLLQAPHADPSVDYHTQTHFAWGGGGRAIIAYWGDVQLALNAAYLRSDLPLSSLKAGGASYSKKGAKMDYREWQVGIGVSYRGYWLIPYVGIDYSDIRVRVKDLDSISFLFPKEHVTFKERYPTGIFLGLGLSPKKMVSCNAEVRFFNENGVSLSADFKF